MMAASRRRPQSLLEMVKRIEAEAAKAETTDELPDLRDDPWFYLDPEHGDERLRRYLAAGRGPTPR
jgi:hypothetical protein